MTAEQFKIKKRVLNDLERSYDMTMYDINRYIRQAGTITIEAIKRLIRWNYFRNEDAVDLYEHQDDYEIIITADMFDLHLWLIENYGVDVDIIENIQDALDHFTTIKITK